MKLLAFVLLLNQVTPTTIAAQLSEPEVRVRFLKNATSVRLEASDIKVSSFGETKLDTTFFKKLQIRRTSKQFILTSGKQRMNGQWAKIFIATEDMKVNGVRLARTTRLELVPTEDAGFDLIADVPLETYVGGVLPNEMPLSWPLEALKAQAIASRSYVLNQMQTRSTGTYDVDTTIFDQVFKPETIEKLGEWSARLQTVLQETKGQILLDPKDQILRTYFHSDCGGKTEASFNVWRTQEPTNSVMDPSCPLGPHANWSYSVTQSELESQLGLGAVLSVRVASKTPSGRAGTVMIGLADGSQELLIAEVFRQKLGFNQLKSTMFTVKALKNGYVFTGHGHGHGVGLCQWGSRWLAQSGKDASQILLHYFPQGRLGERQTLVARYR